MPIAPDYLMFNPNLLVIAGCNGSGKSTWSKDFLPTSINIFDADKCKKEIYDSFSFDFELREQMSWNKTYEIFKTRILKSIENKLDFAYETNFNYEPMHWANTFKESGFVTHLLFFSLKSIELAKERVLIRFQNGGHYVSDAEIASRYLDGFKNLNRCYHLFDHLMLMECSEDNAEPKIFFHNYDEGKIKIETEIPSYFKTNCPDLTKFIQQN